MNPTVGRVALEVDNVEIEYDLKRSREKLIAVSDVSISVKEQEFLCIVGPSGCGKSSVLMAVAGLRKLSNGSISLRGKQITGPGKDRAVVFQSPALLPWRTVAGNIRYGLELNGMARIEADAITQSAIDLVGLSGSESKYPAELSGGMQQRVNLARAIAADPDVILLDEPFASVDAQTREVLQGELLRIWEHSKKTAVFITHQISEAILLGDRIAVMSKGPRSRIKKILTVDLERPRREEMLTDIRFRTLEAEIRQLLIEG